MTDPANERAKDFAKPKPKTRFWHNQIEQASKHEKQFRTRGEAIIDRYRDENDRADRRYSMLWANTQLNLAALAGQIPEADVSRRWMSDNAVVRDGAEIMQKCLKTAMDDNAQIRAIQGGVLEASLPGRGVVRVRYNAEFEEVETSAPDIDIADPDGLADLLAPQTEERKIHEKVYFQRVYWQDYRESPARSQDDVWWRAYRDTTMDRDALIEEFGAEAGKEIPLTIKGQHGEASGSQDGVGEDSDLPAAFGRAEIWEIWDKKAGKIIWIAKGHPEIIREEDPPIRFEGFFDCAPPLVLYDTTDNCIPIAEYTYYQDLALELDTIQERKAVITSMLRVVGFYHSILKGFPDLKDATDGQFLPTTEKAMFALGDGNPGLEKLIATLPIEKWAAILPILEAQAQSIKAAIFEVTGFSDLMRGQTRASETLGAQNLKAQFGSYRLLPKQRAVQAWLEDTYNLAGEVVAEMFDADTLTKQTGIGEVEEVPPFQQPQIPPEALQDPQAMQQAQAALQQAYAQHQQLVAQTEAEAEHYDEVFAFLRDQQMRAYRVNIELDDLARPDRAAMQEQAAFFMQAAGQFIQSLQNAQPELQPAMLAAFKVHARNFKLGKEVEELLDKAIETIIPGMMQRAEQAQQQASQPTPDAQLKAQTDSQLAQMKAEVSLQIEQIRQQAKAESEAMRAEIQLALKGMDAENAHQPAEGPGLDMDTLVKGQIDLEKARIKDAGDTERALIKEGAAGEREMVKAGIVARGQDMTAETAERGKMMDIGGAIAREAMRPAPNGNGSVN